MAYDQNAPYQPPRRVHQPQAPPQAPVQTSYAQYQAEEYGDYNQGYSQDHGQHVTGEYHEYDGYEQRQYDGQGWQGDRGYQDAYAQPGYSDQRPTYGNRLPPQDRNYDPRYQPRGTRHPADHSQHNGLRSRLPPERQGYQIQPNNRVNPPAQAVRSNGAKEQYDRPGTRGGGGPPRADLGQQAKGRDSGNTSMADWKAQEKAKMTAAAASPNYLPQDNAFPKFENPKARPTTSEGKGSARSSDDQRRADGRRPAESRGKSHSSSTTVSGERSSAHGRRPSTGASSAHQGSEPDRRRDPARSYRNEPGYSQHAPNRRQETGYSNGSATNDDHDQPNWPLTQPPPSQSAGPDPRYDTNPWAQPDPRAKGSQRPMQIPEQPLRGRPANEHPPVQPIITDARPAFLDHHPLTPVDVVPRPSTASGAQRFPVPQYTSPNSHNPSSATIETYASPKPWMQHSRHESLDDLYDGYGASSDPHQAFANAKSRDEEIEDEMPDFDNAGVEQSSSMHKRTKTVDRHLGDITASPPPIPAMPSQLSNQQGQQYRGAQRDVMAQQESSGSHRMLPSGRSSQGHAGREPPRAADQYQNDSNRRGPAQQEYADAQYTQPIRPPFANEDFGRRSMDDARQMPRRPGPAPGQRPYQQSQSERNPHAQPHPQQARPVLDRSGTAQTTLSDPGQQRAPSVPPTGHTSRQPQNLARATDPQHRQPDQMQARLSDGDALPHHPTPVRPGLMDQANSQPSRPPPVRNYNHTTREPPPAVAQSQPRQNPDDPFTQPVTREELSRLRAAVDANPGNPKQALILAKKLVEAGAVLASENGRLDQKSTAKNREKYIMEGYKRVKKLVASGYPEAQFYLADCYGQGLLGLEVDTKEAFNLYQAAAKQGHAQAAYRTAVCCELGSEDGGGTKRDYAKAVQWHRRAAALGDPAAMFKLGAVLLKGMLGQPKNIGEAVTWLKRAAERADADHPHALHELAGLYDSVNNNPEIRNKVIADDNYARELFHRAAGFGYKFSQFRLGQAYEYGTLGVAIDNRQSITYYTKAAAQGEHQAELALSGWYLTGASGILEHSDTEAYLWARKAASSEPPLAKALFAMGYFTETGIGCPASLEEAKKWYGRAASLKFPKALERLEELKKNGGKNSRPANGRLTRNDQKRDEAECVVM